MLRTVRVYLILLLVVLLSSCGMALQPENSLLDARSDFAQRLRWHDCNGAARYLAPEVKEAFLEGCQDNDDLRYVHVELQSLDFGENQRQAEGSMQLEYYRLPSVVVKKHSLRQQWSYFKGEGMKQGVWQITSPFPELP